MPTSPDLRKVTLPDSVLREQARVEEVREVLRVLGESRFTSGRTCLSNTPDKIGEIYRDINSLRSRDPELNWHFSRSGHAGSFNFHLLTHQHLVTLPTLEIDCFPEHGNKTAMEISGRTWNDVDPAKFLYRFSDSMNRRIAAYKAISHPLMTAYHLDLIQELVDFANSEGRFTEKLTTEP